VPWWPQRLLAFLHAPNIVQGVGLKLLDARATVDRSLLEKVIDLGLGFFYPFRPDDRSRSLTSRRITALYGQLYQLQQLNEATFDALPEMFGKANMTAFVHLARIARAGHVVRANGDDNYVNDANARNFAIPTLFVHGGMNRCFLPQGTKLTMDMLARVNTKTFYDRHEIAETGHIDCIFGKNTVRTVYPAMVAHLERS